MANEEKKMKDNWEKFQVIFTVLTTIVTAIWGAFIYLNQEKNNQLQQKNNQLQQDISNQLAELDRTIKSVDSMAQYIDKIVDRDISKAKLSAYALYILNKDNPHMAVSLILAANKQELYDVLKDIGKMDPNILKHVSDALPNTDDESSKLAKTDITKSIESVVQAIQTKTSGWCYLGKFDSNVWSNKTIDINVNEYPKEGAIYTIIDDVYLREAEPKTPNYTLGAVIRVNKVGEKIMINQILKFEDKNWVWAKVTVQ